MAIKNKYINKKYTNKITELAKIKYTKQEKIRYFLTSTIVILFFVTLIASYTTLVLTLNVQMRNLETYHTDKSNKLTIHNSFNYKNSIVSTYAIFLYKKC